MACKSCPAPEKCDLCSKSIADEDYFIDGALEGSTKWAYMCSECFLENGEGIGLGKGQIYKRQDDGKWLMVGGFPDEERENFEYSCLYCGRGFNEGKSLEDDEWMEQTNDIICDKCYDKQKSEIGSMEESEKGE